MIGQRWWLRLAGAVVGVLAFGSQVAAASTISVTNGADSGTGSLRAAIAAANPGDVISVPALTVGLTSGQLVVNKSLTITGAGARATTITGSNLSRVFDITTGTVSISGVTITGGNGMDTPGGTAGYGGAITSAATLTLTDSTVTGNQAQGPNEGGGIQNNATLTVLRSTVSFNSALGSSRAGGIGDAGALTVINSTVTHNTIQSGGLGAGIYVNTGGTGGVTFTNDTFALNAAGPSGSNIDLNDESAPTAIANTIILGGSSESCSRMPAAPSVGGNLEDQALCGFTQASDHQNATLTLGALQNNGGPTDTQLPALGSLAIDGASAAYCPAGDQRGVSRPQGPRCDIGAVELTTPSTGSPSVSGITSTAATLTATVNPEDVGGSYSYSYGPTAAYGATTPAQSLAQGTTSQPAGASLTGLTPLTTYHVKITLTTPDGSTSSSDVTFTTAASSSPPPPLGPVITQARMTHTRFRTGQQRTAISATARKTPIGTTFSFALSTAATVQITIVRHTTGRRSGSRCLAPNQLKHRHAKPCTRTLTYGPLTRANEPAGTDQVAFSGRVGTVPLAHGTYKALLVATNAGGRSNQVMLPFTVIK